MSFALLLGLLVFPTPASAEVFDKITATGGDGWDVTFHPTNQNYAFFVHHRGTQFGCLYRLDPDGDGPKQQGDPCFDGAYSKSILGGSAGQKSSAWVTSDGNTAYVPLNSSQIAVINIADEDPNNWYRSGYVSFQASAQYHSNSVMVDDVLWATASTGVLKYDTTTQTASIYAKSMWNSYAPVYYADGKIWSVSSGNALVCVDISADAFCSHGSFVDGVGGALGTNNHMAEYRNTDGSFGGFCSGSACVNSDGAVDTEMVNPFSGFNSGNYHNSYGIFYVTDQHQMIKHQPLHSPQTFTCWDYTTQAACAGFVSASTSNASNTYTIVQDAWNSNCFWSNADSRVIGAWEFSYGNGFASVNAAACDITYVPLTVTLTYDPQGGSGEPDDQTGDESSDVTLSAMIPTLPGYTFTGWNTVADGTGTTYTGGNTYTLPNSGTDTLYAQWTPVASSETPDTTIPTENTIPTETTVPSGSVGLVYDAQGGTGAPEDETGGASSDVSVSSTEPTREGYTFFGWNTEPDGSGTTYTAEDIFQYSKMAILFMSIISRFLNLMPSHLLGVKIIAGQLL